MEEVERAARTRKECKAIHPLSSYNHPATSIPSSSLYTIQLMLCIHHYRDYVCGKYAQREKCLSYSTGKQLQKKLDDATSLIKKRRFFTFTLLEIDLSHHLLDEDDCHG